ncbi:MAG: cytochrome d ubiquinol oxidase subunit II, partial [Bacteroidetes bacterium]
GFSFSVGLLFCGISAFAAAVFLVGESTEKLDRLRFLRMAKWAQIALVLLGGLVFVCAWLDGLPLLRLYLQHPLALISVALATLAVPLLWWSLYQGRYWLARFTAAFQIGMILLGWVAVQYPVMVHLRGQQGLSLMEALASEQVQFYAVLALLAGSALIFPALYYLFRVFKLQDSPRPS